MLINKNRGRNCQAGGNNFYPQFGGRLQKFLPMLGGLGFPLSPGPYPSQPQQPMQPGYYQGYGGQVPAQPAWEQPKKGGIKGFISNLMTKQK